MERIVLAIDKIINESETVKTFRFKHNLKARPGQFVMVSDLRNGEKPFSIAYSDDRYFEITVKKVGFFTRTLFEKKVGDRLMIRGAFGSSFFISSGKVLLVAGGYAAPPLYFLAKKLLEAEADVTLINGAKSKSELVFGERFKNINIKYYETSDTEKIDFIGTSVYVAKKFLEKNHYDFIYSAGPEMMMKNLMAVVGRYEYEFLLERYMKCAIGICGQCTLDPIGVRVCVEGPVFGKRILQKLTEFGKYKRDAAGKRIYYAK